MREGRGKGEREIIINILLDMCDAGTRHAESISLKPFRKSLQTKKHEFLVGMYDELQHAV